MDELWNTSRRRYIGNSSRSWNIFYWSQIVETFSFFLLKNGEGSHQLSTERLWNTQSCKICNGTLLFKWSRSRSRSRSKQRQRRWPDTRINNSIVSRRVCRRNIFRLNAVEWILRLRFTCRLQICLRSRLIGFDDQQRGHRSDEFVLTIKVIFSEFSAKQFEKCLPLGTI